MGDSFSKRLQELRKKKGLTQNQLADQLGVTNKAISKWENDGGMPEITVFPILAKVFKVTTDYLLTGVDNTKPLSLQELCAKNDDLKVYYELANSRKLLLKDESKKDLWFYVKKYDAHKVAMKIFEGNLLKAFLYPNQRGKKSYDIRDNPPKVLIQAAHMFGKYDVFDAFNVRRKSIVNGFNSRYNGYKGLTYTEIFGGFKKIEFNQSLYNFVLKKEEKNYWVDGILCLIKTMLDNDNLYKVDELLELCNIINRETYLKKEEINKRYHEDQILNRDTFNNLTHYGRPLGQVFNIPKKIMKLALDKEQYEIVDKMNEINKYFNGSIVGKHEIFLSKLEKSTTLTPLEKEIKRITYKGIIQVDELIALDDVQLYKKYIELPATTIEKGFDLIEEEKYKELLELSIKLGYLKTKSKIDSFDKKEIQRAWLIDCDPKTKWKKTNDAINFLKTEKRFIGFKQIINHKNIFFFEKAVECDKENMDWALENVKPNRFDVIKLLLDHGAKLHKRWEEDDGWGYMVSRDEVDEIGTEILKKKINDILEGENK